MPVSVEALGIDRLSVRERLELIEQIWGSLPQQVNPDEVPAWHLAELAKRRAAAGAPRGKAGPGTRPWPVSAPGHDLLRRLRGSGGSAGGVTRLARRLRTAVAGVR